MLGEDVGIAAAERAGRRAGHAGQRAHADVVDVALVDRGDLAVDVIWRGNVHSELAGTELRLQRSPGEALRRAHGVVGEPQRVQRLQDRKAVGVVERRRRRGVVGIDRRAAECVHVGREVPAAVVARAVVAPALDAVTELGDRRGVRLHLRPGRRRVVRVQSGLAEQRAVVNEPLGVVVGRQAVDGLARGHRPHRGWHDVLEIRHGLGVDVLGDVGGLASGQDLRQVREVDVVDVRLGSGPQLRGEGGKVCAGIVVDAHDLDGRVGLLERRDVRDPFPVLNRVLRLRGRAVDADGDVAARGRCGAGCSSRPRRPGPCPPRRRLPLPCGGRPAHNAVCSSDQSFFLGLNVGDLRPHPRCQQARHVPNRSSQ